LPAGDHITLTDPKSGNVTYLDEKLKKSAMKKAEIPTIQILVIDDQLRSWYQFLQDVGSRETTKMLAPRCTKVQQDARSVLEIEL